MSAWKSREWIRRAGRVRTGEGTGGNVATLRLGRESSRALAGCLSSTPEALGSVGRDTLWLVGLRTEGHTWRFYGQALPLTTTGLGKTLSGVVNRPVTHEYGSYNPDCCRSLEQLRCKKPSGGLHLRSLLMPGPPPTLKQFTQSPVQSGFGNLQGWRFLHSLGPCRGLHHSHGRAVFPRIFSGFLLL